MAIRIFNGKKFVLVAVGSRKSLEEERDTHYPKEEYHTRILGTKSDAGLYAHKKRC